MPKFLITDSATGEKLYAIGDSAPTEQDAQELFTDFYKSRVSPVAPGARYDVAGAAEASRRAPEQSIRDFIEWGETKPEFATKIVSDAEKAYREAPSGSIGDAIKQAGILATSLRAAQSGQNPAENVEQAIDAASKTMQALEEPIAAAGLFGGAAAAEFTTPFGIASLVSGPAVRGVQTLARAGMVAPEVLQATQAASVGVNTLASLTTAEAAGAAWGEVSVDPTVGNLGKAAGLTALTLLGAAGAAVDVPGMAKPIPRRDRVVSDKEWSKVKDQVKQAQAVEEPTAPTPEPVRALPEPPAPTPEPVRALPEPAAPAPEPVRALPEPPAPTPEPVRTVLESGETIRVPEMPTEIELRSAASAKQTSRFNERVKRITETFIEEGIKLSRTQAAELARITDPREYSLTRQVLLDEVKPAETARTPTKTQLKGFEELTSEMVGVRPEPPILEKKAGVVAGEVPVLEAPAKPVTGLGEPELPISTRLLELERPIYDSGIVDSQGNRVWVDEAGNAVDRSAYADARERLRIPEERAAYGEQIRELVDFDRRADAVNLINKTEPGKPVVVTVPESPAPVPARFVASESSGRAVVDTPQGRMTVDATSLAPAPKPPPSGKAAKPVVTQVKGEGWDVKIGPNTYRIYRDTDTRWWFLDEPVYSPTGVATGQYGVDLLSTGTKADAIANLVENEADWIRKIEAAKRNQIPKVATEKVAPKTPARKSKKAGFADVQTVANIAGAGGGFIYGWESGDDLPFEQRLARALAFGAGGAFSPTAIRKIVTSGKWADEVLKTRGPGTGALNTADPEIITALGVKGATVIAEGAAKTFTDWGKVMVQKFGEAIRPKLNEIWEAGSESGVIPVGAITDGPAPKVAGDKLPSNTASVLLYSDYPKSSIKRTNSEIAELIQDAAIEANNGRITSATITPEQEAKIVDLLVEETVAALTKNNNAAEWYTAQVKDGNAILGVIFPVLQDDALAKASGHFKNSREARIAIAIAQAATSQNLTVPQNGKYTVDQFERLLKTGKYDVTAGKKYGTKGESIAANLELANKMVKAVEWSGLKEFISRDFTIRQLQDAVKKATGRKVSIAGKVDDVVQGAAIFGPKIGQGFLQNILGRFYPVTIDLWFRRTWGRWTGDVLAPGILPEQLGRYVKTVRDAGLSLPESLKGLEITPKGKKKLMIPESLNEKLATDLNFKEEIRSHALNIFNRWDRNIYPTIKAGMSPKQKSDVRAGRISIEELASQLAKSDDRIEAAWKALPEVGINQAEVAKNKKKFVKDMEKTMGRTVKLSNKQISKLKPEWAKSATVVVNVFKPIDIPSGRDREVLTRIVNKGREQLKARGIRMTNADIQATLLYPEKDIWAKLAGKPESGLKQSYDTVFLEIAKNRGLGAEAERALRAARASRAAESGGAPEAGGRAAIPEADISEPTKRRIFSSRQRGAVNFALLNQLGQTSIGVTGGFYAGYNSSKDPNTPVTDRVVDGILGALFGLAAGNPTIRGAIARGVYNAKIPIKALGGKSFAKGGMDFFPIFLRSALGEVYDVLKLQGPVAEGLKVDAVRALDYLIDRRAEATQIIIKSPGKVFLPSDFDAVNLAFVRGATFDKIRDPLLRAAAREARSRIDDLSRYLVTSGYAKAGSDLAQTIEQSIGQYLYRTYRAFTDPDFVPDPKKMEVAAKEYAAQLRLDGDLRPYADLLAEGRKQVQYQFQKDESGVFSGFMNAGLFASGKGIARVNGTLLAPRKQLSDAWRDMLEEIKDPLQSASLTINRLADAVAAIKTQEAMVEAGLRTGLFSRTRTPIHSIPLTTATNSKAYGLLANLFTTPGAADGLRSMEAYQSSGWMFRSWATLVASIKLGKVAFNPASWPVNLVGSGMSTLAQGGGFRAVISPGVFKEAFQVISDAPFPKVTDDIKADIRLLISEGVLRQGTIVNDLADAASRSYIPDIASRVITWTTKDKLAEVLKRAGKGVVTTYGNLEDYPRLAGFYIEVGRWSDALFDTTPDKLTPSQKSEVYSRALEIVKNNYPNYLKVPEVVRRLSTLAALDAFVSFKWELFRTTYETMRRGALEFQEAIRTKNPKIAAIAASRISWTIGMIAGAAFISEGFMAKFGISSDQEKELRNNLPTWDKNGMLLMVDVNPNEFAYANQSYVVPQAIVAQALKSAYNGETPVEAALSFARSTLGEMVGEDGGLVLGPILESLRGETNMGRRIYPKEGGQYFDVANIKGPETREAATTIQKIVSGVSYVARKWAPGFVTESEKWYKAAKEEIGPDGQVYKMSDLAKRMTGIRVNRVNLPIQYQRRARQLAARFSEAYTELRKVRERLDATPEKIDTAYQLSEQGRKLVFSDLVQYIRGGILLQQPQDQLLKNLRDAGISSELIFSAVTGVYTPGRKEATVSARERYDMQMRGKSQGERDALWARTLATDPQLARAWRQFAREEQMGLTETDRILLSFEDRDGTRALKIATFILSKPTTAEREATYQGLSQRGVLRGRTNYLLNSGTDESKRVWAEARGIISTQSEASALPSNKPNAPIAPAPMRFVEGRVYRDGTTGRLVRYQNGTFVPVESP